MMRRHSTYNYAFDNPIFFIDPDGMAPLSTLVVQNDDGTHTVVGGDANDGDNNIYIASKNEAGEYVSTGESIGESLTSHSFFDDYEQPVIGAVIDTNSTEGQDFIDNEIISDNPNIISYMANATGGGDYDLKDRGIEDASGSELEHRYRGSKASNGQIGSARDFGNGAAGIVAGRAGLSWNSARTGFDTLETIQRSSVIPSAVPGGGPSLNIEISSEGLTTQKAQKLGFSIGVKLFNGEGVKLPSNDDLQRFGE